MIKKAFKFKSEKTVLEIKAVYPEIVKDKNPTVILFFGGGWVDGDNNHLIKQAEFFSKFGYVCFLPEYRTFKKHKVSAFKCVTDAFNAYKYLIENAVSLKVDKERIAVGGGSAGGHLASLLSVSPAKSKIAIPKAVILFNPVVDTSESGYGNEKFGDEWEMYSPYHKIGRDSVENWLIFHGTKDKLVPIENVRRFCSKLKNFSKNCLLIEYDGRNHGFFNFNSSISDFSDTVEKAKVFLDEYL